MNSAKAPPKDGGTGPQAGNETEIVRGTMELSLENGEREAPTGVSLSMDVDPHDSCLAGDSDKVAATERNAAPLHARGW